MNQANSKILIITLEPIGDKMAGPAIRALEIGKRLATEFPTTVLSPVKSEGSFAAAQNLPAGMKLVQGAGKKLVAQLALSATAIFVQANVLKPFPFLASMGKHLIVDLYDPYLFSVLVQYKDDPVQAGSSYRLMHQVLEAHMTRADFTVCASERQRDYWLGRFCALGRVSPKVYAIDRSLRKLIDVVPYGVPEEAPLRIPGRGLRDRLPSLGNAPVLLWGGGIWDWFDPLTVIKAVKACLPRIPDLKLVFMGTKSPNPKVPVMDMTEKARALAGELSLTDESVFFLDGWVPYEERSSYLLDATIAVSAHFDLPETRFSFRTRILDYFWCGLPILTTRGDQLADMIDNRAGLSLPYEDVEAWQKAIEGILLSPQQELLESMKKGSLELAGEFLWDKNVEPLRKFLREPHHLPDFEKVTMPNLFERAHAVYRRGGQELILKRSAELFGDILKS
ncbi:MAG TPA: glycosyltransferase [Candidatus Obscuribacter sp.]|nr:glycosyltransferase [Candidatus Obscuribacter sp.]HNB16632.1 glycosyltransferase [Candidatus Obscuribacter sp.]